jgi:hypothetical protein
LAETIEVVRGRLTDGRSKQVADLWSRAGAAPAELNRERLAEVVSVALDEAGELVGTGSVRDEHIPLIGRRFWVYRSVLAENSGELAVRMFNAAFEALHTEFNPDGAGPIGLCVLVADRDEMERRPEPLWEDTELLFAGYLPDDRQVRIRYFWGAKIGPGLPTSPSLDEAVAEEHELGDRFRIETLAESTTVTSEDVINLWTREGVLPGALARQRVNQVHLVAIAGQSELAGISTIYLQRSPQLRMNLWFYRTFVASPYRESELARHLTVHNRDLLEDRFASGEDTRGQGIGVEVEHERLRMHLNNAYWPQTGLTFIGEDRRGWHVRVYYFRGARVPPPRRNSYNVG